LPANEYAAGGSHIRSANETPPGPGAPRALAPLTLCIGAGLVLAFTPVLVGEAVPRSLVADNDQWELRAALNAYLLGTDRAVFEKAARSDAEHWFWESPERQPQVLDAFMRKYDEVVQNPDRFIAEFGVRYMALPADKAERGYLREGWTMLQQGPYWQIWAREKSRS
jgi:hypothetical protein